MRKVETERPDKGYLGMSSQAAFARSPAPTRDREIIRVDLFNDKLGIADSLRRAFVAASEDECTRDFEKLIDELH